MSDKAGIKNRLVDGGDTVVCRECSEAFGQITQSHLSMHGMTMEEYREEYPDAPVQSDDVRSRVGWTDSHGAETREAISESVRSHHGGGGDNNADAR